LASRGVNAGQFVIFSSKSERFTATDFLIAQ
jgi:hypothetical protein